MSPIPSYFGRTPDDMLTALANATEIASEMKMKGAALLQSNEHASGRLLVDYADRIFAATAPPQPKT